MSVTHLMPWKDPETGGDGENSFRELTHTLRNAADVAYTVSRDITEPCDHSDAPEGEDVVCAGKDIYVRAAFGRVLLTVGNGSLRSIDVASTPRAAQEMAEQAMAALVFLEDYDQITGPSVPYPSDETVALFHEAQDIRAKMKRAADEASKAMEDPRMLREIGLEMLKKARAMGAEDSDTGERTGQYV